MQEWVYLEVNARDHAQAKAFAGEVKNYLNASHEDRYEEWGKGIEVRGNEVVNYYDSDMTYNDYCKLKEELFEHVARALPEISFDGGCEYGFDEEDMPSKFRKMYRDGILYEAEGRKKEKLIFCSNSYSGKYIMPADVDQICCGAFRDCCKLEIVFVSENVNKIGKDTFSGCTDLSQIHIPDSVKKIAGKTVFKGCTNLTIYAPAGSCAETYAKENNIPFSAE